MRFGHGEFPHARYRNQYALLMAMATTAGLREAMPELRTFVLSRSGFAGIQRYAANWMGDNVSRWDHLRLSIAMGAGFGVSGQAFIGADIGGFAGNATPELFLRWMQYGVLTPFCRNHSEIGNVDQYAWSFGDVIGRHVRTAVQLRYRLLPYLYACFLTASETGAPVQRPLVFDSQYDGAVRDLDDQYLLGPDLLVAPVTEPGMTARQVYLPAGDWYDWHTDAFVGGACYVTAPTPMEQIPVYARGGAVIPMWAEAPPSTSGYRPRTVELHLFVPVADGAYHSMLAEDDGLTFAALDGACFRTTFEVGRAGHTVVLQARTTGNGFAEFARERFVLVLHGARPDTLHVDGAEVSGAGRPFRAGERGLGLRGGVRRVSLLVRLARPDEYAAVGAITAAGYRADGLLDSPEYPVESRYEAQLLDAGRRAREAELWVAVEDAGGKDELLGTVTWCPVGSPWRQLAQRDDQAEFRMLAVAPAGRRRGIGRRLVEACLERAHQDGHARSGAVVAPADVRRPRALPGDGLRPRVRPGRQPSPRRHALGLSARALTRDGVQVLEQVMGGELDLLVPPLGGPVDAGDQGGPVHPAQVAVDKGVAGLGLIGRADGQAEMPGGVLRPGMSLQEGVLVVRAGLHLPPVAVQHVLPGIDQPPTVGHGLVVHLVLRHYPPILIASRRSWFPPRTRASRRR